MNDTYCAFLHSVHWIFFFFLNSRDFRPGTKCEYTVQVQLRWSIIGVLLCFLFSFILYHIPDKNIQHIVLFSLYTTLRRINLNCVCAMGIGYTGFTDKKRSYLFWASQRSSMRKSNTYCYVLIELSQLCYIQQCLFHGLVLWFWTMVTLIIAFADIGFLQFLKFYLYIILLLFLYRFHCSWRMFFEGSVAFQRKGSDILTVYVCSQILINIIAFRLSRGSTHLATGCIRFHLCFQLCGYGLDSLSITSLWNVQIVHAIFCAYRFCLLETSCEQDDNFPPSICVRVNSKMAQLPVSI